MLRTVLLLFVSFHIGMNGKATAQVIGASLSQANGTNSSISLSSSSVRSSLSSRSASLSSLTSSLASSNLLSTGSSIASSRASPSASLSSSQRSLTSAGSSTSASAGSLTSAGGGGASGSASSTLAPPSGSSNTLPTPTSSPSFNATLLALVTSSVTSSPPGFSTMVITSQGWSTNTWLTTSGPQDKSSTILPVIVGCPGCGPLPSGIVIWNLPEIPNISFQIPGFPGLPKFHLPCVKIFGIRVSGDCSNPPPPQTEDEDNPKSTTADTSDVPSSTGNPSSSSICTKTITTQDLFVGCVSTSTVTGGVTQATQICKSSTSTITTTVTGGLCTVSGFTSTTLSSASACQLRTVVTSGFDFPDSAVASLKAAYSAAGYAAMYSQYTLDGFFPPPPSETNSTSSQGSSAGSSKSSSQSASQTASSGVSSSQGSSTALPKSSSQSTSQKAPSTSSQATSVKSQPTTLATSTLSTASNGLPILSKQCYTSSLVNCKYIFNPATVCPTTTELLPASCTDTPASTTSSDSGSLATTLAGSTPTTVAQFEFYSTSSGTTPNQFGPNVWKVFTSAPGKEAMTGRCGDVGPYFADATLPEAKSVDPSKVSYPSATFTIDGGCVYNGDGKTPGTVDCGGKMVACSPYQTGTVKKCNVAGAGTIAMSPMVECNLYK